MLHWNRFIQLAHICTVVKEQEQKCSTSIKRFWKILYNCSWAISFDVYSLNISNIFHIFHNYSVKQLWLFSFLIVQILIVQFPKNFSGFKTSINIVQLASVELSGTFMMIIWNYLAWRMSITKDITSHWMLVFKSNLKIFHSIWRTGKYKIHRFIGVLPYNIFMNYIPRNIPQIINKNDMS